MGKDKPPLHLDPNSRLGEDAKRYYEKRGWHTKLTYMRLSGDGYVCFGLREDLPSHTQQEHFVDHDGTKYDAWENKVSVYDIINPK